jgi:hypothetical protein
VALNHVVKCEIQIQNQLADLSFKITGYHMSRISFLNMGLPDS